MPEIKKHIKIRKGLRFATAFTMVYFCIGGAGIFIIDVLLGIIIPGYRQTPQFEGWIFLCLTSAIMFFIALRFIYRDREHIRLLIENRKKLHLYKSIFDKMHEGLIVTDENSKIISVNPSFESTTGYSQEDALNKNPGFLNSGMHSNEFYMNMWHSIKKNGKWKGEIINKRKNGEIFPESLSITAIRDSEGQTTNYIGIFSDISKQREAQEKLEFLTHYDSLTRLPKYHLFMKHLNTQLALKHSEGLALYIIEIRKLKALNAAIGYKIGDEIIQKLAIRLQTYFKGMTLGRVNSKDFALLVQGGNSTAVAINKARVIINEIESPLRFENEDYFVTANIGISIYPEHGDHAEEFYKNADAAKAFAKINDKSYELFNGDLKSLLSRKVTIEKHLMKAIERDELRLYFQPQIDIKKGEIAGLETLLRWQHSQLGIISPQEFIPVAEETGLIIPIGEWIIEKVCEQQKIWQQKGYPLVKMAINLSPKQFQQPDLVEKTAEILERTEVDPRFIEFEITESISMFQTKNVLRTIYKLKELGIKISIDDFGTGHSSLSYLQKLPIDHLKIDRSFVWDIPGNKGNIALTRAMVAMAHELNLTVVAEGVETYEQLLFLDKLNCDYAQGYYFSKPLPLNEISEILKRLNKEELGNVLDLANQ